MLLHPIRLILFVVPTLAAAETRVALVTSLPHAPTLDLLSLAEVEISKTPGLKLLDRAHIAKTLAEHEVALTGLTDAAQAVRLGQLLSADLIAVVEGDAETKRHDVLGLVVFDAKTGVRYVDQTVMGGDTDGLGRAVADLLSLARVKQESPPDQLHTLCLLTVRNADLPREMDGVCLAVGRLVERRVLASHRVALLERQRLEHWNRERELPAEGVAGRLRGALVLLSIDVGRDDAGLRASVQTSDARGREISLATARAASTDPVALADNLVAELLQKLGGAPSATPDPAVESRRFLQESRLARDPLSSLQTAEAAYALNRDIQTEAGLARALARYAAHILQPGRMPGQWNRFEPSIQPRDPEAVLRAMTLAIRSARLIEQVLARPPEGRLPEFASSGSWETALNCAVGWSVQIARDSKNPDLEEEARALKEAYLKVRDAVFDYWAAICVGDAARRAVNARSDDAQWGCWALGHLSAHLWDWTHPAALCHDSADAYLDAWQAKLTRVIELSKPFTPGPDSGAVAENIVTAVKMLKPMKACFDWGPREYARVRPACQSLRDHPHPAMRLAGDALALWLDGATGDVPPAKAAARVDELFRSLETSLASAPQGLPPWAAHTYRGHCYRIVLAGAATAGASASASTSLPRRVCELMIARGEYDMLAVEQLRSLERYEEPSRLLELTARLRRVAHGATDDPYPNTALAAIDQFYESFLAKHPGLAPATQAGVAHKSLLQLKDANNRSWLTGVVLLTDAVLVLEVTTDRKKRFRLLRVAIPEGQVTELNRVEFPPNGRTLSVLDRMDVRVLGDTAYIGTPTRGICAMPLSAGPSRWFDKETGLPSDYIGSLAIMGGRIYAGIGHRDSAGMLISIDPHTGRHEVLASSRRSQARSPLENTPSYNVSAIVPDPERRQVLFLVEEPPQAGLWRWSLEGGDAQLLEAGVTWIGGPREERLLQEGQTDNGFRLLSLRDLTTGSRKPLLCYDVNHGASEDIHDRWRVINGHHKRLDTDKPFALIGDALWCFAPLSRIDLATSKVERLPPLDPNKHPTTAFHRVMLPMHGRYIVYGHHEQLWLLDLAPTTKEAKTP